MASFKTTNGTSPANILTELRSMNSTIMTPAVVIFTAFDLKRAELQQPFGK